MRTLAIALIAVAALIIPVSAEAQTVRIVAFGASNTAGSGVGPRAAWPARLDAMLQAKGYDARVANAGITGDDTGRMLARLNAAVPEGTHLVIVEPPGINDRQRGVNTETNVAAIVNRLKARNIKTIVIPGIHSWVGGRVQPDGRHISAEGHAVVANKLLPQVIAAIGQPARR